MYLLALNVKRVGWPVIDGEAVHDISNEWMIIDE